jgi:hypothetical protein
VASVIAISILASVVASWKEKQEGTTPQNMGGAHKIEARIVSREEMIADLASSDSFLRQRAAGMLFEVGRLLSGEAADQ